MRGSARGLTFLYLLEASAPRTTPTMPVTMVSAPKIRLMGKNRKGLVSGGCSHLLLCMIWTQKKCGRGPLPLPQHSAPRRLGTLRPLSCLTPGMPLAMWRSVQHPSSQASSTPGTFSILSPPKTIPLGNLNSLVPISPQPPHLLPPILMGKWRPGNIYLLSSHGPQPWSRHSTHPPSLNPTFHSLSLSTSQVAPSSLHYLSRLHLGPHQCPLAPLVLPPVETRACKSISIQVAGGAFQNTDLTVPLPHPQPKILRLLSNIYDSQPTPGVRGPT